MNAIGGFDTGFWPGEDTVACLKIVHELGRKIVYDPRVLVFHHRRDLFQGHLRQVKSYALHRGYFVKRFPKTSLKPSYFLPSLLLAYTALGWAAGLVWPPAAILWALSLAAYLLLALIQAWASLWQAPESMRGARLGLLVAGGVVATHLTYGWHFLAGLLAKSMKEERRADGAR